MLSAIQTLRRSLAAVLIFSASAMAETNLHITLSPDGLLSWTNSNPSLYYSIEWKPSLNATGAWNGSYRSLQDVHSSNEVVTVPVPMFFRLSGSTGQTHTLTLSPDSAALSEGHYAATNLSEVDPDLSGENIRQGIAVFGVEGELVPTGGTATAADVASGKTFYGFGQTNWTLQVGTAGDFTCAPGFFDLNGLPHDECEFQLDPQGIYVSVNDPAADDGVDCGLGPVGTGAGHRPCLTIARGIQRAVETGRTNVYVANGFYNESLTLANGVNLNGGFNPADWSRNLENSLTIIRGNNAGLHKKVLSGALISQALTIEGFIFFGQPADQASGNSYVIWLRQCSAPVTLRNNIVFASNGADGARGVDGASGANGQAGSPGADAISPALCTPRSGGAGGSATCSGVNVSGGNGGGNSCPPTYNTQASALAGATATGTGGGTGGTRGFDARRDSGGICVLPTFGGVDGGAGSNGATGANGTGGLGAVSATGTVSGNEWTGSSGGFGVNGQPGRGGGGGGAGGGAQDNGGGLVLGGTGGGGGAGGCSGAAGVGGSAGGGAFGVFVSGGVAPAIQQCTIYRGRGGNGGNGGAGGLPGKGGTGAAGGAGSVFCSGPAGAGGAGGQGGAGGGGGGASGGVSYGIYLIGATGVPNYGSLNNFVAGAAGQGGSGGQSLGNSGSSGTAGGTGNIATF